MDLIASQIPPEVNLVHYNPKEKGSVSFHRINGDWWYKYSYRWHRFLDLVELDNNLSGWTTRYQKPEELKEILPELLLQQLTQ